MSEKQPSSFVLVKCQFYVTGRTCIKVAFGIFIFLTPSLSGGKPPSFDASIEKLARATSPPLSQGVGVAFNREHLVASDEVEHNTRSRGKSRGAEKPVDCGVGKLIPRELTTQKN